MLAVMLFWGREGELELEKAYCEVLIIVHITIITIPITSIPALWC
jgi:hypothetical protein